MSLQDKLKDARIRELEREVARLRQALCLCPEGVERGQKRLEALQLVDRPSVARRALWRR